MRKSGIPAIAMFAVLVAGCSAGGDPAQQAQARQMQDRIEIEDLMWRYATTLDSADADGYAAVYTEDGKFSAGNMAIEGREALHKFVADLKVSRAERVANGETVAGTLHMTANHKIEFVGTDAARIHSYWFTVFPGQGLDNTRVAAAGRGLDELVRVDGKWLFKVRNVAPQD